VLAVRGGGLEGVNAGEGVEREGGGDRGGEGSGRGKKGRTEGRWKGGEGIW